jgi:hypothetical protein
VAHHINAIVTDAAGAAALAAPGVPLDDRLVLVALTQPLCARLDGSASDVLPGWEVVTPRLIEQLRATIASPFAVVETEYFGGQGCQRAGAWHRERTLVAAHESANAVSVALAALGVSRGSALDEWQAVGLVRFRSNDDLRGKD